MEIRSFIFGPPSIVVGFLMCLFVRYVVAALRYTLVVHCRRFFYVRLWVSLLFELCPAPCVARRVTVEFLAMSPILLLWVS